MNPNTQSSETSTRSNRASNGASSSTSFSPAMKDIKEDIMKSATEGTEAVRQMLHQTRASVSNAMEVSEEVVRKHPFYSIAGAVAAGAVLGALIARRR